MSRDGARIIYLATTTADAAVPDPWIVVDNGTESARYHAIAEGPVLSPDGSHCWFKASKVIPAPPGTRVTTRGPAYDPQRATKYLFSTLPETIRDGQNSDIYSYDLQDAVYSGDGSHLALIDRRDRMRGGSLGGPHLLYTALSVDGATAKVVGTGMGGLSFSPDGKRVAVAVKSPGVNVPSKDYRWASMIDSEVGPLYNEVGPVIFSPDSQHTAYAALKGGTWLMVVDSKELADYELLRPTLGSKPDPSWNSINRPHIRTAPNEANADSRDFRYSLPYCFASDGALSFMGIRDGKLFHVRFN
jgi:hypothetical protein